MDEKDDRQGFKDFLESGPPLEGVDLARDKSPMREFSPIAPGDFKTDLIERLKDKDYAGGYLAACLHEGPAVFALAVTDVAVAMGWGLRATITDD